MPGGLRRRIDMCKAFSCIVDKKGNVTWKFGVDSHEELIKLAKLEDKTDNKQNMQFARIEISPKNNDYLKPDKWVYKVDESIRPEWLTYAHEKACMKEFRVWKVQLYKILIKKPIVHPFKIAPPKRITAKHIALLKEWVSVRDSVRDSVGASVRAYIGSFFVLERNQWKYTSKINTKGYPFESLVKLWEMGLVPSFDGTTWRFHGGKDAKVLFEITTKDLKSKMLEAGK